MNSVVAPCRKGPETYKRHGGELATDNGDTMGPSARRNGPKSELKYFLNSVWRRVNRNRQRGDSKQ